MTYGALQAWVIGLGAGVFVSFSPLCTASADTSTSSAATSAEHPAHAYERHYTHRTPYGWRNGRHDVYVRYAKVYYPDTNVYYPAYGVNPVATVALAVVDSIAALGAIATYPIVCFPYYGSCPVHYGPY